jgi:hypothetical protein
MHYGNQDSNKKNSTEKVVIRESRAVCGPRLREPEQKMKQRFWGVARGGGGSESGQIKSRNGIIDDLEDLRFSFGSESTLFLWLR